MAYIILIVVVLLIGYLGSKADKFQLSSKLYIIEEDEGWVVYSKTWDAIIYFVDRWNDNLDMYNEVTLYDFPGVYWNQPLSKLNIDGRPPHENGYLYKLQLPPVSDDWGYKNRRNDIHENQ